MIAAKHLSREG